MRFFVVLNLSTYINSDYYEKFIIYQTALKFIGYERIYANDIHISIYGNNLVDVDIECQKHKLHNEYKSIPCTIL